MTTRVRPVKPSASPRRRRASRLLRPVVLLLLALLLACKREAPAPLPAPAPAAPAVFGRAIAAGKLRGYLARPKKGATQGKLPAVLQLVDALNDQSRAEAEARAAAPAVVLAILPSQDEARAKMYLEGMPSVAPPVTVECLRAPPGCVSPPP